MFEQQKASIKLIVALLVMLTMCYSQSIDDMIKGPLLGFTFVPDVGKFDVSMSYVTQSANSAFNDKGKEISFNDNFDGLADPELSQSAILFSGDYAINNATGVSIYAPFISSQSIDWNPASGYEEYFENANGETGLGDISISAWYQILKDNKTSIQVAAEYQLATGSSPEDVSESSVSSTGSGHTSMRAGIGGDFITIPKVLFSARGSFTVNQEAAFSSDGYSWDEKEGSELSFSGRASLLASPQLSIGIDVDYFSAGESELDGETIDGSESNFMAMTPMVGYKFVSGTTTASVSGGYLLMIAGDNFPKSTGMVIGVTAFF